MNIYNAIEILVAILLLALLLHRTFPLCLLVSTIVNEDLISGVKDKFNSKSRRGKSCSYKLGWRLHKRVEKLSRPITCDSSYLLIYDSTIYTDLVAFKFTGARPSLSGLSLLFGIRRSHLTIKFVSKVGTCPVYAIK